MIYTVPTREKKALPLHEPVEVLHAAGQVQNLAEQQVLQSVPFSLVSVREPVQLSAVLLVVLAAVF